jgi:DNA-binding transcriptional regulator YiaG
MFHNCALSADWPNNVVPLFGMLEVGTGSSYEQYIAPDRTTATPVGKLEAHPVESTAETILEIRRRSGLTWEELGDLFEVSRRSVHHWASGKPVAAKHEQALRQTVTAIRCLDRGDAAVTRAFLLSAGTDGIAPLELLKIGLFEQAVSRVQPLESTAFRQRSLSSESHEARRPPAAVSLLQAEQDRPVISTKAKVARSVRAPKGTS